MAAEGSKQLTWGQVSQQMTSQLQQWFMATLKDPKYGLKIPADYNAGNEIESAMFEITNNVKDSKGTPALQCCTRESIMSAIRYMAEQGLSVSKKQGYFIVYGNQLSFQRSYFGTIAALKHMFPDYEVAANVLYEGDKYAYCTDPIYQYNYIDSVESSLENRDKPIVAAYGSIIDKRTHERVYGCVMTMKEIQKNWAKAKTKNVQNDFPQEMAKRTLINRMCKLFVNTSNNASETQIAAFNRTTEAEYDNDNLENITPPENEAEKEKLLRGKSKGQEGLKALLSSQKKTATATVTSPAPAEPEEKEEEVHAMPAEPDDGLEDVPVEELDSRFEDGDLPF